MKKNSQGGFTLIELLVVIAIIGILASVVLASLNSARSKGADAAIKANLANARAQAELFYDGGSTYASICTSTTSGGIYSMVKQAADASGATLATTVTNTTVSAAGVAVCHDSIGGWAAAVPLKAGSYYCVDSTGASKTGTGVAASAYVCS